jgi:glyoxylase-like metal-dependent hydrolase (beta-lactamase superfamily II)
MGKFEKLQVGNATLIALQDSWAPMKATAFFGSVEDAAWEPYRDLLKDDGTFVLNIGAWLVHSEGRTILVDTGIGSRPVRMPLQEPPALPSVMEAAGVGTDDVDTVVLTHLHFDHTGWNTTEEDGVSTPLFGNARHIVQQAEWDHWTASDDARRAAQYDDLLAPVADADLLDLIEGEQPITSELVAIPTPGHTPGHMSFVLASGGERAYLLGDAAHHPAQLSEPSWSPNADVDPALSSQTRAALFERIEREEALIASGHFPFPGLGHARRDDGTLRFEALEG